MSARPRVWVILLTVFLDLLGFGLLIPTAPYIAKSFHATDLQTAWLTGAYSLSQFLFVPVWGRLSDRIGRRPVMLMSVLGTSIAMAFFGWAPTLVWLFIARFTHGAMTANIATAQAYMADISDGENRAKSMGLLGAAFGMGFIVGPAVGGLLASYGERAGFGYSLVGYGGAVLSFVNFVFAYFYLVEPERKSASRRVGSWADLRQLLAVPAVGVLMGAFFVSTFAFAQMTATYALLTMQRLGWTKDHDGARHNGYVFGFIGIIAAVIQGGLLGRLVKRFQERRLLIAGLFSMGFGLSLLGSIHGVPLLLLASVFISTGNSLSTPTLSSLISVRTPPEMQGSVFGVMQSLGSFARLLGPACAGILFQEVGPGAPYYLGAALMVGTGGAVLWRMNQLTDPTPAIP